MALEVRMTDEAGRLIRTQEDVTTPRLPVKLSPDSYVLAEYCFNEEGPWVKPVEVLHSEDVAAVVFSKRGRMESMVVSERVIHDEEEMRRLWRSFIGTTMTRYAGEKGKEIFVFHVSPRVRGRLSKPWKRRKSKK